MGTSFRTIKRCRTPRLRLLCFPHAGGAASFYRSWADSVPDDVEVMAVRYPGREDRLFDEPADSLEELARSVAWSCDSLLDTPLALFGHSMGATVAYETAVRLQQDRDIRVAALFVSARTAPGRSRPPYSFTTDAELLQHVQSLGGTDGHTLRDPQVLELVMPSIRHDYHLVAKYRGVIEEPLQAPVVAFYGTLDQEVAGEAVADWSAVAGDTFSLRGFPGNHFYLMDHQPELVQAVFAQLDKVGTGAR
jgi:pyochelin biosynthetic protein PchC